MEVISNLTFSSSEGSRNVLSPKLPSGTYIKLKENRMVGLRVNSYSICLSFYNISAELGNNTLSYSDGTTTYDVTLDDGIYSIATVSRILHRRMYDNGHYGLDDNQVEYYPIDISAETHQSKNMIEVKEGGTGNIPAGTWSITLDTGIAKFLGFEAKACATGSHFSENPYDVNTVTEVNFICDGVGVANKNIGSFVPDFSYGAFNNIIKNINNPIIIPLRYDTCTISESFTIQLTDQNGKLIEFSEGNNRIQATLMYL
eukprot:GCRY01007904.1.p1 GENE.GCRY01007904.1~~GCRY01007904.1.p1  ORF type:complete len:258 (+),score=10.97 GCRY01007904.1:160-933(+)